MIYKLINKIRDQFFLLEKYFFKVYLTKNLISIGQGIRLYGKHLPFIKGISNIKIGKNFKINEFAYLNARSNSNIIIGDSVTISSFAKIITASYDVNLLMMGQKDVMKDIHKDQTIFIGDNCWIGMNAIILPGVSISGVNVIIAAGSVVTRSFEDSNVLIAGNPAKVVKKYV